MQNDCVSILTKKTYNINLNQWIVMQNDCVSILTKKTYNIKPMDSYAKWLCEHFDRGNVQH